MCRERIFSVIVLDTVITSQTGNYTGINFRVNPVNSAVMIFDLFVIKEAAPDIFWT